jgi:sulfatase maturation enzyme AslB (radical SAM superfamily)
MSNADLLNLYARTIQKDLHVFCKHGKWVGVGKTSHALMTLEPNEAAILSAVIENGPTVLQTSSFSQADLCSTLESAFGIIRSKSVQTQHVENVGATQLILADSCNMRCSYCYGTYFAEDSRPAKSKLMNSEVVKAAVDFTHKIGAKQLGFFGGEPLLNFKGIETAITHSRRRGYDLEFSLTTNGSLITDEIADYFRKYEVTVSVSTDGAPDSHNATRKLGDGSDSHHKVLEGIRRVKSRGVLHLLEMTYSNKHPLDLRSNLEYLAKHSPAISVTCVEGASNAKYKDEIIAGDRLIQYYRDMFDYFIETRKNGQPIQIGGINELVSSIASNVSVIREHVCSTVLDRVTINIDGNIYPCPETMSEIFGIGNVLDPNIIAKFSTNRAEILAKLKKGKLGRYWFTNLTDVCVSRITGFGEHIDIEDASAISDAIEEILYMITELPSDLLIGEQTKD